jgi:hypothetical protein
LNMLHTHHHLLHLLQLEQAQPFQFSIIFLSFIRTHVWCKHSSLNTLDLVFGWFFVQLQVIGLLFMHLQCGDWLCMLLYVFKPMEQW